MTGVKPLVIHLNGPAKLTFEAAWRFPGQESAMKRGESTPAQLLQELICRRFSIAEKAAAASAFAKNVAFFDPTFHRITVMPPLNFTCEFPLNRR